MPSQEICRDLVTEPGVFDTRKVAMLAESHHLRGSAHAPFRSQLWRLRQEPEPF